jgi:beta-glucosidase-like glycosyl hydrolase
VTPCAGRDFETFGEGPLLVGDMVAAEIRGIQGEGLIATVKHLGLLDRVLGGLRPQPPPGLDVLARCDSSWA